MSSFTHALNIGTLATWLSVAVFGVAGILIHPQAVLELRSPVVEESQWVREDFTMGSDSSEPADEAAPEPVLAAPVSAPPGLPQMAEIEPLPEVPGFSAPAVNAADVPSQATPAPRKAASTRQSGASSGRSAPSGRARSGSGAGASGMSTAARIAAGHMPAPSYPAEARRKGQTGTVVVEFAIDSGGRVTYANAVRPSPWPLLNQEAVRTVMLWRFPPGEFITLERPIVFRLK